MTIVEPEKTNLPATVDPDGDRPGELVPATNGAGDGILARIPSAEELHAKAQELRDELARVEALLECVERMRGASVSARYRQMGLEECLPVE